MSEPAPKKEEGLSLGKVAGFAILGVFLVFSGVLSFLANQIAHLFQVMKMNAGPILGIAAAVLLFMGLKGRKGGDDHKK